MKPGYKIIIIAIIFFMGYKYYNISQKEKLYYENEVNKLITDLRHQDYFAIQTSLIPNRAKEVSIEDIKLFVSNFNLTKDAKFSIDSINKESNITTVVGKLLNNSSESIVKINFKDINNTLYISSQEFGNKTLKSSIKTFPILVNH